jgi:hypothetical protein
VNPLGPDAAAAAVADACDVAAHQRCFVAAIAATRRGVPAVCDASHAPGFRVHANTGLRALMDALVANHPSIAAVLGDDVDRVARAHALAHPAQDGRLLLYGAHFADTLRDVTPDHPGVNGIPLHALARADRMWTEAHVAADEPAARLSEVAAIAPHRLPDLRLRPLAATRWHVVPGRDLFATWDALRRDVALPPPDASNAGTVALLVTRPADEVMWSPLPVAGAVFLQACRDGHRFGEAVARVHEHDPDADLSALLPVLFEAGALRILDPGSDPGVNPGPSP